MLCGNFGLIGHMLLKKILKFINVFFLSCFYWHFPMKIRSSTCMSFNSLYPSMLCAKVVWNWSKDSQKANENVKSLQQQTYFFGGSGKLILSLKTWILFLLGIWVRMGFTSTPCFLYIRWPIRWFFVWDC